MSGTLTNWYANLIAAINTNITTNRRRENTGAKLNTVLNQIVSTLGNNRLFGGAVSPSDSVTANTETPIFYIANTAGTYTNFGNLTVASGELAFLYNDLNGVWNKISWSIATLLNAKVDKVSGSSLVPDAQISKLSAMPAIMSYDSNTDRIVIGNKTYQLTEYVPIRDYFVGWVTGSDAESLAAFASLSANRLQQLSTAYYKDTQSSVTKQVAAGEAVGDTQIFFLMWRDSSAPVSGSITSGGISDSYSEADFLDTDIFNAEHDAVEIEGVSYHVAGMFGTFDQGDQFIVNF